MKTIPNLLKRACGTWILLSLGLLALPAAAGDDTRWNERPSRLNLVERLEKAGKFTTLLTAVDAAGLTETLATGGPFTLFAPTDEAFAKVPADVLNGLLADKDALTKVLLYHVLSGRSSALKLLEANTATTLEGNPVLILRDGHEVTVNHQEVVRADIRVSNGIIHAIDGVLLPPGEKIEIKSLVDVLKLDGRFTTLLAAVQAAGLVDALAGGQLTLFAPTDEAFAALPPGTVEALLGDIPALTRILTYHVLGETKSARELVKSGAAATLEGGEVRVKIHGWNVFINESQVINANVNAPNGFIHTIDKVLLPPPPTPNLVGLLKLDGRFNTLVAALAATGLDEVVGAAEALTIFAPTDEAFAALPAGAVEALLAKPDDLKKILLYHVVAGEQSADGLLHQRYVETLQGAKVVVYGWWGRVFVNRSAVIDANVMASNGVVHAINRVLMPPAH